MHWTNHNYNASSIIRNMNNTNINKLLYVTMTWS